jgi:hypothetical protein
MVVWLSDLVVPTIFASGHDCKGRLSLAIADFDAMQALDLYLSHLSCDSVLAISG